MKNHKIIDKKDAWSFLAIFPLSFHPIKPELSDSAAIAIQLWRLAGSGEWWERPLFHQAAASRGRSHHSPDLQLHLHSSKNTRATTAV